MFVRAAYGVVSGQRPLGGPAKELIASLPLKTGALLVLSLFVWGSGALGAVPGLVCVVSAFGLMVWARRFGTARFALLRVALVYPTLGAEEVRIITAISSGWERALTRRRLVHAEAAEERVFVASGWSGVLGSWSGRRRTVNTEVPSIASVTATALGLDIDAVLPVGVSVSAVQERELDLADDFRLANLTVVRSAPGIARLRIRLRDPLESVVHGDDFFRSFPGSSDPLNGVVVALDEERQPVRLPVAHGLIVGQSGSGKGSVLYAMIRALLPARDAGLVKLVGLDPKAAEFQGRERLFDSVALMPDEIAECIRGLRAALDARKNDPLFGRTYSPSRERPLLVCFFDEYTNASTVFDSKQWKDLSADLRQILAQGRSYGVVLIGAGQEATKESVGNLRDLFGGFRVALRLASSAETGMVLGPDAVEEGAAPHRIAAATAANGYSTAGVGYLRDADGQFRRVRFPYTSDTELDALCEGREVSA
ncbi:FtsK/SpoIIIE domain-containing protein [Cellulosimicrobium sp. CpK407]|uniref:FtsK/SpoIIIE domain-containing protein n=1 Tax=Cellulosimicrobium sp. CpK407 TaxID=3229847 RepID=UPI003F418BFA